MVLTEEVKKSINTSVLCWLATVSANGFPNVSPKEIFNFYDDKVIVANIASPQTVQNIKQNKNVCISFIDILVQKGFQLKGTAKIVKNTATDFEKMENVLLKMTGGNFPFRSITEIIVTQIKQIIAPKYILYPSTTETEQIESAKKTYNL